MVDFLTILVYDARGQLDEERRFYLNGAMPLTILHGLARRSRDAGKTSQELEAIPRIAPSRSFKKQRSKNNQRKQKEIAKA